MMTIREECRNFHNRQYDLTALAEENHKVIGYCDYTLFNNEIFIQYIEVAEEYRLKGVARQLFDFIHKEYSDKKINYGYTTDDGTKFMQAYKKESVLESLSFHDDIKKQILELKKTHRIKIIIDTSNVLVVQTNYETLKKYISKYVNKDTDYVLQFLIFNFNVPISDKNSCYGVTMSLKTAKPVTNGCQNKANENVTLLEIEKACDIKQDYLENYVKAIANNLHTEIESNLESFPKIFQKYKDNVELLQYIAEIFKTKLLKKKLDRDKVLPYLANVIEKISTVKKIKLSNIFDDLSEILNFAITTDEASNYERMFVALVANDVALKYNEVFKNDDAFTTFLPFLKEQADTTVYNRFLTYFFNSLTLDKMSVYDYENLRKYLLAKNSNAKEIFKTAKLQKPELIEMMQQFLNENHVELKNFNIDFVLKNQEVLKLSNEKLMNVFVAIYNVEENIVDFEKNLKALGKSKGMSFATELSNKVADSYFNRAKKFNELLINKENAAVFCKLFVIAASNSSDKTSIVTILNENDLVTKFILYQKDNDIKDDLKDAFVTVLEKLKLTNKNILNLFYNKEINRGLLVLLAGKLLEAKGYNILTDDEKLSREEELALALSYYAYKNKTEDDKIILKPANIAEISEKLKLHYNKKENAFETKLSSLNLLKDIIIYDDEHELDLEHVAGEKESYIDALDFFKYWTDVNSKNKKILNNKIASQREKDVNDAVNIAIADALHVQLLKAIFTKLNKTGYFKSWSDGKNYHIANNHYVILVTDKFLIETLLTGKFETYKNENLPFDTSKQLIANNNKYIELEESDFEITYDKNHMNFILQEILSK